MARLRSQYTCRLLHPRRRYEVGSQTQHLSGNHRRGVLVLAGNEGAINYPVVGKRIAKSGFALKVRSKLTQFGFGMLWCAGNAELVYLLVGYPCDPPTLYEWRAVFGLSSDQSEWAMAAAADYSLVLICHCALSAKVV